jgi:glycosyltransferase involved in cell wall biosynthesis
MDRYDFTIITARLKRSLPVQDQLPSGVKILRIGFGSRFDKWLFPFLAPLAARIYTPNILHAVLESYAGFALVMASILYKKPKRLLTLQSTNTDFLLGPMHRAPHRMTAISSVLIERAKNFGRQDVELIPNGIAFDALSTATKTFHKIPGRILFVGRLEPMKGVETLLEAFARAREEFPKATLHLVGDGSLRTKLWRQARELGITEAVSFKGYMPPIAAQREFAEAEIFCGLSRSEALGNVFIEAQAAKCAVIATNIGGIPEVVKQDAGILVPVDDIAAAVSALKQLLESPDTRHVMAEKGYAFAKQYDWKKVADKYDDVYQTLLKHT